MPPAALRPGRPPRAVRVVALLGGLLLGVASAVVAGVVFCAAIAVIYDGHILPGVRVGGVALAGLDRPAAEARLRAMLPDLGAATITLRSGGQALQRPAAAIGRDLDLGAALDAALATGRSGPPLARGLDELALLLHGVDIGWTAGYDAGQALTLVTELRDGIALTARDASVVAGEAGGFRVLPSQDGRDLDTAAAARLLGQELARRSAAPVVLELPAVVLPPRVTTLDAEGAVARATAFLAQPLTLTLDDKTFPLTAADERSWITFGLGRDGSYGPALDPDRVAATVAPLAPAIARNPTDATLVSSAGTLVAVIPSVDGRALDVAGTVAAIEGALLSFGAGPWSAQVPAAVTPIAPRVSSAGLTVPHIQLLGAWTTSFVPGINNYYGNNIRVPARLINGTVLAPGAWFDFWSVVRLDAALGFGPGGYIRNGRSEPTGAFGGGICSASTTMFNAALRAGLRLGARQNHYYYITRYPLGLDATVWIEGGSRQTVSFRNDTAGPLLILGSSTTTSVTFQVYGVADGRQVQLTTPIVKNRIPAGDTVEYTTTLPHGVRQRLEVPAPGMDVWVSRTVTAADGSVLHQETFYSHYGKVDGLTLIGQ